MHSRSSLLGTPWTDQPAALAAWFVLVIVLLSFGLGLDRTFLIDQPNYLDYFARAPTLEWVHGIFSGDSPLQSLIVAVFSEEILWEAYATVLGTFLSPPTAVYLTVCLTSLLLALAVSRLRDPVTPLVIWILLPVGFAVTGLLQLRQGFAFAMMMYTALRLNKPLLAALLAAMIHATFALVVPFALISWLCERKQMLAVLMTIGFAFAVAYLGSLLFETFGGRRLAVYSANESETNSILYVFGGLLCSLPSLHRLLMPAPAEEPPALSRALTNIATVHIGVIAFVVISYFIFPLGAGRIGYLVMLLLIPILPTMRRRDSISGAAVFALLVLYLIYLTVKTFLEGTYDVYLTG